jgi:hypothetical protein
MGSVKVRDLCNRPWRPIGLWDVEAPTFPRQPAHRRLWACQSYAPATLYPQGSFPVLISFSPRQDALVSWPQVTALSLSNKILLYKTILKPIWTYGIQLWGTASTSNVEILERFQSKVHHGMCRTLLSDAISTCQRSRKKSATTALTTASASLHTQTTSSQPSSSHLNTGDCEDSCPSICLPDSSVIVVISTLVCKP